MIAEQLKKAVLQAAIQGKLTEQLPEDGDARDLLKDIQKEKARLVKEGKLKKEKPLPEITNDEIPFDIPENWVWVRLQNITSTLGDGIHGTPIYDNLGEYYFINGNNLSDGIIEIKDNTKRVSIEEFERYKKNLNNSSVLISINGTLGNVAFYNGEKVILGKSACYFNLIGGILKYFIKYLVNSEYFLDYSNQTSTGTTIRNVSLKALRMFPVPLPPLAEQQRIVEKLNQVLPEIENLALDENKLDELEKAFPKKMKDAILQAAIQGKLTEQLPEDGNACDLLKDIQQEKARLVKEGKLKKEKPLPEITEDEIPFDIPENWVWARLGDLCKYIQRGKSPKYSLVQKFPVIAQKCVQWAGLTLDKALFIDPHTVSHYSDDRLLQNDDLLWNSTGLGTLGRIAIYSTEINPFGFAVADSHVTVLRASNSPISSAFIFRYISSPRIQSIVEEISSGTTKQKELATETIKRIVIPLPPLAEQQRIVDKLDQVLPLLDRLE